MRRISYCLCTIFLFFLFLPAEVLSANHSFTGLPITASGWTDFETIISSGYSSARVVFVSYSSGNNGTAQNYGVGDLTFDSNGIFQAPGGVQAYQTLAAAYAQIRDGYPDILLLKRGDSWSEYFTSGGVGAWAKSGSSASARIIIGSYGTGARPILNVGANDAFGSGSDNLIISSLRINGVENEIAANRGDSFVFNYDTSSDVLIEDCYLWWTSQVVINGNPVGTNYNNRFALRRNVIYETRMCYVESTHDILFEENILIKTANKALIGNARHLYLDPDDPTTNHSLTGVILKGNIFYDGTDTADRAGGDVHYNLIVEQDEWLIGGHGSGSGDSIQSADFYGNVISDGGGGAAYPAHLWLRNNDGTNIRDNIWLGSSDLGSGTYTIQLTGYSAVNIAKNIEIKDNIVYNRYSSPQETWCFDTADTLTTITNVVIHDNDFQLGTGATRLILLRAYDSGSKIFEGLTFYNNRYYSSISESSWFRYDATSTNLAGWVTASGETGASNTQVSYTDSSRTIGSYNQSIGGTATTSAFMTDASGKSRTNWSNNYKAISVINYIRSGFDKGALSYGYSATMRKRPIIGGKSILVGGKILEIVQ